METTQLLNQFRYVEGEQNKTTQNQTGHDKITHTKHKLRQTQLKTKT